MRELPQLALELAAEAAIESETSRRRTAVLRAKVIRVDGSSIRGPGLLSAGTIVTLIARRGTSLMHQLEAAIRAGEPAAMANACATIVGRAEKSLERQQLLFSLAGSEAIVDVTYRGSWLARHTIVDGSTEIAISQAVWSGGQIDEDQFSVRAYTLSDHPDLDVLIILVEPKLSEIEQAILKAVPADLSEVHIKGPSIAWTAAVTIGGAAPTDPSAAQNPSEEGRAPVRRASLLGRWFGRFADEQQEQVTTVQQQQRQQDDTRQQQQQQQNQQADTKQQQQQQQQQQQDQQTRQQQQQQQHQQNQDQNQNQNQEKEQQQQQQQARQTEQQQQQQQRNDDRHNDGQRDQAQYQNQQERQANTQKQEQQHDYHQHQDKQTKQQQEWGRILGDFLGEGLIYKGLDLERYSSLLEAIDFSAMDATQSVKRLLWLREELLKEGLG